MIGKELGPYRVLDKLGEGGMGEVYRAQDTRLHREVAIKVLPPLMASDPDRIGRFEQEARATAALNHPNIVALYDIGNERGTAYVVSELLTGATLREPGSSPASSCACPTTARMRSWAIAFS
jgi:serine/threonine protein kinase